jgi:coenzyme F420-reducing hydrogenase beta subunit
MRFMLPLVAASAMAAVAAPAFAAPWQNINARQAELDRRIDGGVNSGELTRVEARRLRAEFNELTRLEAKYRRSNGLQAWERVDLDRRFTVLSARVRWDKNDGQDRGWQNINQRQAKLDQRIDGGIRNGSLTRTEAVRLRSEFQALARLEDSYRRSNGLQANERADLDRRFDTLSAKIKYERRDGEGYRR